jgi:methionine-rich copper-binding protein CopC
MRCASLAFAAALALAGVAAAQPTAAARVVATSPAVGAQVPASTSALSVTFDRPMQPSWSFAGRPQDAPSYVSQPSLSPDGRTISVAVQLQPGRSYVVWLNSESYKNFRDAQGQPAEPFRLTFSTSN